MWKSAGKKAVLLGFPLYCFTLCRLIVCVPFPFVVWTKMWMEFGCAGLDIARIFCRARGTPLPVRLTHGIGRGVLTVRSQFFLCLIAGY